MPKQKAARAGALAEHIRAVADPDNAAYRLPCAVRGKDSVAPRGDCDCWACEWTREAFRLLAKVTR